MHDHRIVNIIHRYEGSCVTKFGKSYIVKINNIGVNTPKTNIISMNPNVLKDNENIF